VARPHPGRATRAAAERYRRAMSTILASGTTQILLATGAGAFAILVAGIALFFTLDTEDRGKLGVLLRHPVKAIFEEDDEPDRESDDYYS
jgi:hypothetical protein